MSRARTPASGGIRDRYYVVVSVLYLVIGVVILGRSIAAHVLPVGILGLVFLALGVVRLRDFARRRATA